MILSNVEGAENSILISSLAKAQIKSWENGLSIRIALQRVADLVNKFPHHEDLSFIQQDEIIKTKLNDVTEKLRVVACDLNNMLEVQVPTQNSDLNSKLNTRKRKAELSWESTIEVQKLRLPHWKAVTNKHHARLHFGSEHVKSKLRVFNQSFWDQV